MLKVLPDTLRAIKASPLLGASTVYFSGLFRELTARDSGPGRAARLHLHPLRHQARRVHSDGRTEPLGPHRRQHRPARSLSLVSANQQGLLPLLVDLTRCALTDDYRNETT